jgi:hypothetical protein
MFTDLLFRLRAIFQRKKVEAELDANAVHCLRFASEGRNARFSFGRNKRRQDHSGVTQGTT